MNVKKLSKMVKGERFDEKIMDQLLKFGERVIEPTVKLAKKKADNE